MSLIPKFILVAAILSGGFLLSWRLSLQNSSHSNKGTIITAPGAKYDHNCNLSSQISYSCPVIPPNTSDQMLGFLDDKDYENEHIIPYACSKIDYIPSALEKYWSSGVSAIVAHDPYTCWHCGCLHARVHEMKIHHWLEVHDKRNKLSNSMVRWSPDVFSYHLITNTCSKGRPLKVPIEPLFGFLRHPFDYCFNEEFTLNKNYMIQRNKNEIPEFQTSFFFDLGASTYTEGDGGASQSWFVEKYRKRGINFDRIFAWEVKPLMDEVIFQNVPPGIVSKLTYFNLPADPTPGAKHNPWRILAEVAKPSDFVVVKVDIDSSAIEIPLIRQIIDDSRIRVLVDEVYFEHHVSKSPMHWRGWGDSVGDQTLPGSYKLFSTLRELGIRAHSWV